jgi:DNA modification methylase
VKAYPPSLIKIRPDRQRKEFDADAMQELFESIDGGRLLQAPVVCEEVDGVYLVAGERRLRVIQDIFALGGSFTYDGVVYKDLVPTVTLGELDELEREEAELDENIRRKDLTWQEEADGHARLHALRQKVKDRVAQDMMDSGQLPMDGTAEAPKQTIAATAKEIFGRSDGGYQDQVRKEIIVAPHLKTNAAVAKAKTIDDAYKILKRQEADKKYAEEAQRIGASATASSHQVFNMNCLEWMAEVDEGAPDSGPARAGMFDIILTDPPYGMGADLFNDAGGKLTTIEHNYKDDYESWQKLMQRWCYLSWQITKSQAHAYVFCDIDRFHELKSMMQGAGWYVFRTPLIVHKLDSGRVPLPDRGPRRCWEAILYAIKGDMPVTAIYPDVIPCKGDENVGHGAQKPVELYHNLLMRSARPGMKVIDTFAGTGPLIPAAHQLKCEATLLEMEPASYGKCLKRLADLKSSQGEISFEELEAAK